MTNLNHTKLVQNSPNSKTVQNTALGQVVNSELVKFITALNPNHSGQEFLPKFVQGNQSNMAATTGVCIY